ncbi:MAG: helix-turn-helix domain-containing protein [Oscillospiraceae bacterium]|jgi:transcriptional regulator with XRE-family HTH domain|nr:helix-turn-helix domain-containing protein [Oscillospiraceae bacterium]
MFSKEIFSERIKYLRCKKNVKQSDVAEAVGITNRQISMMETGQRGPSAEVLCALADYFGVSLDYLTGRCDR